ncbi:hypothetical protein [Streptomyces ureilyticus]|uniref:Peptidase inhibitor family I36 n=1 Tax=Streptomyces ureilyticus TaxID=1775131 RepID=A0ABX0DH20_9ACTN|nr:hypothetical protein [Streptomyces ureilyticus]NGO41170.1 hypothetical protein [Streptomyces ureilyticus]
MCNKQRSLLGVFGALLLALVAVFAAGPAQAAVPPDRDLNQVLTLPAAPASTLSAAAVSPTITPAVRTEHGRPGDDYTCPSGNLCLVVWDPTTVDYKVFFLYTCQLYALHYWQGWGNFYDAQTGGVTSYFYDQNMGELRRFTPEGSHNIDQNWDPVWYVRNC